MQTSTYRTLVAAVVIAVSGSQIAVATETEKPAAWNARMRELGKVYGELILDLSSDARFKDPKNHASILRNASKIADAAKELHRDRAKGPDADLTIGFVTEQFREEAGDAVRMLKTGNRAFARNMLRSMSTYCIACHSRMPTHDLSNWVGKAAIEKLPPMDRAGFLAATRQFNPAIETYEGILRTKDVDKQVYEYERAARSALALRVRVKNDVEGATALADSLLLNPASPYFFKEQVQGWRRDLVDWKSEKPRTLTTEAALFEEARRLITAARTRQRFPADRSADVSYLRATSVLHRLLMEFPKSVVTAEALLLLGQSYEILGDVGLRDFHESYYVACIRMAPHTRVSRECYGKYEESVYLGYTGSAGTDIPSDVRKKLNALELLSVTEPPKQSPQTLQ